MVWRSNLDEKAQVALENAKICFHASTFFKKKYGLI